MLLDLGLQIRGCDVLAARGDDDVLLAAGDLHVALGIDLADVAGVKPPVDQGLRRRLGVLVVALEDVRAADEDFAVVGDLDLAAWEGLPTVPNLKSSGVATVAAVEAAVIPQP